MTLSGLFSEAVSRGRRVLFISLVLLAGSLPLRSSADCLISGPAEFCAGSTNTFLATPSITDSEFSYSWSISNNAAQAVFLGDTHSESVEISGSTNGTFSLHCTVNASEGSETCTTNIIVHSLTTNSLFSDQMVCSNASPIFSTQPDGDGPFTFVWRKDGELLSWATTHSITVSNVSAGDAGQYCVEVSGFCNTVTNCATLSLIPPPTLVCPSNLVVNCPQEVPSPDTNSVIMTGGTNVSFAGDQVTTNPCGLSILRSYESVNSCGNTSACTQLILVANTNPPVLACATNHDVECGTAWDFDNPSAIDFCGNTNVVITVGTTVTNLLPGGTFTATRTWNALDSCSNSATCSQTITLIDTTRPEITCSSNIVVECAGLPGNEVTFVTTATDSCDPNVVPVSTPPSGSFFSLGTNTVFCVATDGSGNSNVCSFTITVRDTTPPQITCPSNMNVAEAPRDSGFATVAFPAPVVSDLCDNDLTVYYDPASGSSLPIGTNTINCTVVDHSGNSNTCPFTVRVIPYRLQVTVTSTADSGPGTLRQALLDANDSPDENLIVFNLPGPTGTIHLLSALPEITSPLIIDGWSQPGFSGQPLVELDGSTASNAVSGLVLGAGSNTVRGLVLQGFTTGIRVEGSGGNVLQGNYIGPDLTGTNSAGNSGDGIWISSPGNLIGGINAGEGNVISGNASNGIVLTTSGANNNSVQGNSIGLAVDGIIALGNGHNGILLEDQTTQNFIGGLAGNKIAFNSRNGIVLTASAGTGNGLLGNSIFENGGLGIDLGDNEVTVNDPEDTDAGPNNYQNFPVLTDAQSIDGTTTIFGELSTIGNNLYRIEFFLNNTADASGYGEGAVFIGSRFLTVHGNGTESFTASFPVSATYTQFITATVTGPLNDTSEFSPAVQVRTPPVLGDQPAGTNAPTGSAATFCASASGTPPISYRWRLNGVNIPGATNACYTISAADVTNGGSYTVLIGNGLGALATIPVSLTLPLLNRTGADNFANRVSLQDLSGVVEGQNRNATFEHDEPLHAGKFGGKSVWYSWIAPVTGVATFRTLGSSFDTLMAVYSGTSVSNLTTIESDEDRAGFYTSKTVFNAIRGRQYQIAIDGFDGSEGDFVLEWSEQDTPHLLPKFLVQPQSQTVVLGANVTLTAVAVRVCGNGHQNCPVPEHYPEGTLPGLSYQWYLYGSPIPGATSNLFTVTDVQTNALGIYTIRVSTLWQTAESQDAILQFNSTGSDAEAADKLSDAKKPLFLGASSNNVSINQAQFATLAGSSVVRGYTGTQIFNTVGSATSPGEIICGVIGGASEWISLVADESGSVILNTDGSTYDTVVAVFRRSPTNSAIFQLLACDNNSGTNGLSSSVSFPVVAGQTNYIDVDGVGGATGILQLNYSLATQTILKSTGVTSQGAHLQVIGRPNMNFVLQASTNLTTWSTLISTNSTGTVFDYIDTDCIGMPKRYYRALLLP